MAARPVNRKKREVVSPQEAVTRAHAAEAELSMLREAFEIYADAVFHNWAASRPDDAAYRERLYFSMQAIGGARDALISIINNGNAAEADALMRERFQQPN